MKADLRKRIQNKLDALVREGVSSGAQLALGHKDQTLGVFCSGTTAPHEKSRVNPKTWFDLASLTKILSTTSLFIRATQEKKTDLSQTLKVFFPFLQSDLKNRTLEELINHRAHLPAIVTPAEANRLEGHERKEREHYLLRKIDETYDSEKLTTPDILYSDVGFLILGFVLEQIYAGRLSEIFGQRELMQYGPLRKPLWIEKVLSRRVDIYNVAQTLDLEQPGQILEGEVQDPRAAFLGGDAGHAGLFGGAAAVETWGLQLYKAYHGKSTSLSDRVLRSFIDFEAAEKRALKSSFMNGFDRPALQNSQAGRYFSPNSSIGHLGYTGASFWMDIEKGYRVTLLCHRFQSGIDAEKLKTLRPLFHDWLWLEVFSKIN